MWNLGHLNLLSVFFRGCLIYFLWFYERNVWAKNKRERDCFRHCQLIIFLCAVECRSVLKIWVLRICRFKSFFMHESKYKIISYVKSIVVFIIFSWIFFRIPNTIFHLFRIFVYLIFACGKLQLWRGKYKWNNFLDKIHKIKASIEFITAKWNTISTNRSQIVSFKVSIKNPKNFIFRIIDFPFPQH